MKKILMLQKEKSEINTSHVVHLILTILTGLWAIVWVIAGLRNISKRKAIDVKILEERIRMANDD